MAKDSNKKIFIIEDNIVTLSSLQAKFSSEGISVAANNGGDEKNNLINEIHKNKPDFIILDIMLPAIDGFELLTIIKQDMPKIPVFVLTNLSDRESRKKCEHLGADYFFVKNDLMIDDFVGKVKKIISNRDKIANNSLINSKHEIY